MFKNLVLSGGGFGCLIFIGFIKYFEEHNMLKDIENIVTCSGGCFIGLALCLGYTYQELFNFVLQEINSVELGSNHIDLDNFDNLINEFGFFDTEPIHKVLQHMVKFKLQKTSITFMELAKLTGKNLVVCVTNLTHNKAEYFSVDTTPDLNVVDAICMSSAIPIIFTPLKI
jgi:predicted acylesterase/phospholipase RssA